MSNKAKKKKIKDKIISGIAFLFISWTFTIFGIIATAPMWLLLLWGFSK